MEDFKVRMIDEAAALNDKIMALEGFIYCNDEFFDLPWKRRVAMRLQLFYMRRYYFWLSKRINWLCSTSDIKEITNPEPVAPMAEPVEATETKAPKKTKKRKPKKIKTDE